MPIFIGIEGVGMRRSFAVAANENGTILGAVREKFGISLQGIPREVFQSRLRRLIQEVAHAAGRNLNQLSDATVCIGVTGVDFPYDAEIDLPREFGELRLEVGKLICTGDAEIVFASHAQTEFGAAILCHMGLAAYITKGPTIKDRFRVGGWGPALADEGSGFWLGRSALREIADEFEKGSEESPLWQTVSDWLSKTDPEITSWDKARITWNRILDDYKANGYDPRPAIFTFTHEIFRESGAYWHEVVSGLTSAVIESAIRLNDKSAEGIITKAIEYLSAQFIYASEISGTMGSPLPLVLYGGVLTHNPEFRERLITSVKEKHSGELKIILPTSSGAMRPVCGALLFALSNSDTKALRLPTQSIIDRVRSDSYVSPENGNTVLLND